MVNLNVAKGSGVAGVAGTLCFVVHERTSALDTWIGRATGRLAVGTKETRTTGARVLVVARRARATALTRLRRALVNVHLALGARKARLALTRVLIESIDTLTAVLTGKR